jgi:iron complex outermembrane receptor protein
MLHPSLFTKRNIQKTKKVGFLILCLSSFFTSANAQTDSLQADTTLKNSKVFELGEVVVSGEKSQEINNTVDAQQLQNFYKTDAAKALNLLPGVTLSNVGPRNEAMVYVRGFDLRQVPVLIDGIPVYVPYDGYVDLARFTSFDLSEVNVSKGYTSVIYGPNALGGAINLVSRKPTQKLELQGASGWMTGGYRTNLNIGSNLGKFYFQGGVSQFKRDYYPLSKDFTPTKIENGGRRDNSYSEDKKYSIKIGFTPKGKSEYALSYIYQDGKKGTPVYTGSDVLNSQYKSPRYWQWPYWDKQSLYFISNTQIDKTQYIKTRLYYDIFRNLLNSYDDATYSTITKPYAFKSYYNDYTIGGIVEYGKNFLEGRDLFKATLQYKQDVHREHNQGEPVRTMSDQLYTVGFENELKIGSRLRFLTGFSYNYRESIKAMNYNSTTKEISNFPKNHNDAYNVQGGLVYRVNEKNTLNLSVAKKTRFATVKDRYSYRLGTAIPNPDLNAEYAYNFELGYKGTPVGKLLVQAALFYNHIYNTIQNVNNVQYDPVKKVWLSQLQNVGQSEYMGGEIGVEYPVLRSLKLGANYTYIERHNLSNPTIHFTDVPNHKLFGYVQYQYTDRFYIQLNSEYDSKRYSTSYGTVANGFALFNTKASVKVWKYFSVEAGVNNILDRNYALTEGYPEMGRNYFANVVYKF